MSLFDTVLDNTVAAVEQALFAAQLESATVIRDLKGRVRLALKFKAGQSPSGPAWDAARAPLEQRLSADLGPYWGNQIWRARQRGDAAFTAVEKDIERYARLWADAPTQLGGTLVWYKLERTFSKSSWLESGVDVPWSLDDPANPAIVSFYSFKGGVGRTTALAAVALILARRSKKVVVLDLDLEAPGVGSLLLGRIPPREDGIVDYLLELQLTGDRPDLSALVAQQNEAALIENGEPIRVLTSGRLDASYLEKIARLDYESFVSGQVNPLSELLKHIREEYSPDFVFLDVRSGLHDLGGLSLNGMSHLDVLFGLDTPQSWTGLKVVLGILSSIEPHRGAYLVHAMPNPTRYDPNANRRFREQAFDLFNEHYFHEDEDVPDLDAADAPYGMPIPYDDELLNIGDLASVVATLTRSDGPYVNLARVIGAELQRDTV